MERYRQDLEGGEVGSDKVRAPSSQELVMHNVLSHNSIV